jgi:uncharacterized protein (DUF779 family)
VCSLTPSILSVCFDFSAIFIFPDATRDAGDRDCLLGNTDGQADAIVGDQMHCLVELLRYAGDHDCLLGDTDGQADAIIGDQTRQMHSFSSETLLTPVP